MTPWMDGNGDGTDVRGPWESSATEMIGKLRIEIGQSPQHPGQVCYVLPMDDQFERAFRRYSVRILS